MYSVKNADVGTPTELGQEINHSQPAIKAFKFVLKKRKRKRLLLETLNCLIFLSFSLIKAFKCLMTKIKLTIAG